MKGSTKITLSFLSIAILILAYLLLPKIQRPQSTNALSSQSSYSVRRVMPTSTVVPSPSVNGEVLIVRPQAPSKTLKVSKVDFKEGGYLVVYNGEEDMGISESFIGVKENIEISLVKETSEGDILKVLLLDKEGMERASIDVNIITTALSPGVILPRDLQ